MKFFINSSFNRKNSGIEHAQLKRADLFKKNKEPFKMVFREWAPQLHNVIKELGDIDDENILSMFDFFQKAENVVPKTLFAKDVLDVFGVDDLTLKRENDYYVVKHEEAIIGRVHVFTDDIDERVSMIEYFDGYGNLYRVDQYDFRGFPSLIQWYTPDNKVGSEVWYTVGGKPVLETYNRFDANKEYTKSGWRLTEDDGAVYMFDNIDELTKHFYNRINEKYWSDTEPNIFILDRNHLGDWSLLELDRPAYVVLHLHNSHAGDAQDPMHSMMNNFYEYSLTNANKYDAIVSATDKQTKDVAARFKTTAKLFTIPVGIVPDETLNAKRIPMNKRTFGKVLATARIAPEKRLHHLVKAVGIAKEKVPEISLDLYGYIDHSNNDETLNKINAMIKKYDLADQVNIHEYADDVAAVQNDAQVYGLASIMEGFNLAIMEAISHGMVGVTYDVNYGPNEIIVDEENGFVIPYGDADEMGEKFIDLFTHPEKLQEMSDRSYELAERYSEKNVWKAWQQLFDDAKKKKLSYVENSRDGVGNLEITEVTRKLENEKKPSAKKEVLAEKGAKR